MPAGRVTAPIRLAGTTSRGPRIGLASVCGRFVSAAPPDELARYFDVQQVTETVLDPSYNVAPTDDVYVVLETGGVRRLGDLGTGA